jgi:hypothetical protein
MFALVACAALLQQKTLVETKFFPGGTQSDFVVFLRSTGTRISSVYEDRIAKGFSPMRCKIYSDGSHVYDPPIPSIIETTTYKGMPVFRSKLLPLNFFSNEAPTASSETNLDTATQLTSIEQGRSTTSTRGAMRLGNGLPLLKLPVEIHPFFDDFWVNVSVRGDASEAHLDMIAFLVGGKLLQPTEPGGKYRIDPDVSTIRSRLLLTLDYKTPRKSVPAFEKRESIVLQMIRGMKDEQLLKWINAAKNPFRFNANELSNYKEIKSFRDMFVEFAAKSSPNSFTPQNVESLRASAIEVEFDAKFAINFFAILADGKQLRF